MTLVMACLLVTIGVFGCICLHLSSRIDDERIKREIQNITIDYLVKRVDVNKTDTVSKFPFTYPPIVCLYTTKAT